MPRPARTSEEIDIMRQRILDAAHALIHEGGPERATVRRIADRLDVSHMTLYNYFPSRQAIIQALRESQFTRMQARQQEQLRRAEAGETLDVVREELGFYARFAEHHPEMYRLIFVKAGQDTGAGGRPPFTRKLGVHFRHLSQLIHMGVEQGIFVDRDTDLAAHVVITMTNGPLIFHTAGRLPNDELFDLVWNDVVEQAITYLTRR